MLEIRFHGRGGQEAVTSAELLAKAALTEENMSSLSQLWTEKKGCTGYSILPYQQPSHTFKDECFCTGYGSSARPVFAQSSKCKQRFKGGGILIINSLKGPEHFIFDQNYKK